MLGTGLAGGAAVAAFLGTIIYAIAYKPPPGCCIDGYPGVFPLFFTGPLAFIGGVTFAAVAGTRRRHRRPLRKFQSQVAGMGFQLRF